LHDRRKSVWLLGVVVSMALVAAACGSSKNKSGSASNTTAPLPTAANTTAQVKKGGTLNYGADQEPTGFNNNTSKDNGTSVVNIMDRVWPSAFHYYPDITVHYDKQLLTDDPQVTNQDPQTVVFHINPNASWSDGVPITADDFIYFWNQQKDPANTKDSCTNGCAQNGKPIDDATDGTGYKNIDTIVGSNNGKTVTVTFKKGQPFSDWRSLFQIMPPAHIAEKVGWTDGFDKFDPNVVISGGPYKISSYNTGKDLTLVPNDKYWGTPANLNSVIFHFITDSTQQVPALQNKEVDMIYPQPQLDQVNQVKQLSDVNSELNFGLSFEHIDFNQKNQFLADEAVRKAIALAIDRKALVAATVGQFSDKASVLNNRMFVTNQPEYKDTSGGLYDKPDVAQAKTNLQNDGFTLGGDGIFTKGGKRLSMRISTTQGNSLREQEEQVIQAQLKAAGIDITIANLKSHDLFGTALPNGDFDIALFAWVSTPFPSGNNPIYTTGSGSNYDHFSYQDLDAKLAAGAGALDHTTEAQAYNDADTIAWQHMVTLPLFQKPTFIAVRNNFANIGDNSTNEGPFWNAETWGLKTTAQ
jgi:peptide/nickel transport system substrate-binding protein